MNPSLIENSGVTASGRTVTAIFAEKQLLIFKFLERAGFPGIFHCDTVFRAFPIFARDELINKPLRAE